MTAQPDPWNEFDGYEPYVESRSPSSGADDAGRRSVRNAVRFVVPRREGAVWVLLALALPRLVGPLFTIVLRRLLGPAASGIFDTAMVPYRFLDNFRNFGTGPALVYERPMTRAAANTAWTLNMLFAVAVTAVAQALAHPLALYYGHPEIEGVFRILSIGYVFASVSAVHSFLLMRELDFRSRAIPALGQVIVGGDVAVLFAVWGFGVGSFVSRELASIAAGAILLWAIYPFRPRLQLVPDIARRLLRYGGWIGIGMTLLFMSQNVDVFIGARIIYKPGDIGFYTTSWRLAFIVAGVFTSVAGNMVFPTLSRLQHDPAILRRTLLQSIRQLGLVILPSAGLLAVLAPVLIVPLLGHQWSRYQSSFMVLSLLAIYAGNRTVLAMFFEGYKSIGRPAIVPVYNLIKLVIMVPAMIYGAHYGILGLALTYVPIQLLEIPAALYLAHRTLAISPLAVWRAVRLPIAVTVVTAGVVTGFDLLLGHGVHMPTTVVLLTSLPIAVAAYMGTLWFADRSALFDARRILFRGLHV